MERTVDEMTIGELRKIYPNGFAVSVNGTVEKILAASSHLPRITASFPLPPSDGGYLVVESGKEHQEYLRQRYGR